MDKKTTDYRQKYAERTRHLKAFQLSLQAKIQTESPRTVSTSTLWGLSLPIAIPTSMQEIEQLTQSALNTYHTKAEALYGEFVEGKTPEYVKIQREIRKHYQLRDTAFFQAMVAERPEEQPVLEMFTAENNTYLTSPLELISEVKAFEATKDKELKMLEQQLKMLLATQRNWKTFIIEQCSPSFILNYFKYESLQTKISRQVQATTQAYAEIQDEMSAVQRELIKAYDNAYERVMPEDLDTYHTSLVNHEQLLSAYIEDQPNEALEVAYQQFLTDKTVKNLKNFYQLFSRLTHEDETTHTTATDLILQLYPQFTPYCHTIQKQLHAEYDILVLIKQKHNTQIQSSAYRSFLHELHTYYQIFIAQPTAQHLSRLYDHITTPVTHKKNTFLMRIMTHLETYYAQPLSSIKGTPIAHINSDACFALIEHFKIQDTRTETMSLALKFLSLPTWEHLAELEDVLQHDDYHTDPTTTALIEQLMDACLFPSQAPTSEACIEPPLNTDQSAFISVASEDDIADEWLELENTFIPEEPLSDYPTFLVDPVPNSDLEQQKVDNYAATLQYSVALLQTPAEDPAYSAITTLRDHAFFAHMNACELIRYDDRVNQNRALTDYSQLAINPAIVTDVMSILPSTLTVLQKYRSTYQARTAELDAVQNQILGLEEAKPEQVIRSFTELLNSFTSGFTLSYFQQILSDLLTRSFKAIVIPDRKTLITRRNELRDEVYKAKVALEEQWKVAYHTTAPQHPEADAEDLQTLFNIMQDALTQPGHTALTDHFQKWLACSTETTLVALYQQLGIMHYYHPDNRAFSDSMATLQRLYPDMSPCLTDTEQQISTQLYQNDQMYRIAMAIPHYEAEAVMLPLQEKLKQFLNTKSEYPFVLLYQHLMSNPVYQTVPQAQQLLIALQTLYPEMVTRFTTVQAERIPQTSSETCRELLIGYYTLQTTNPVFAAVKSCLSSSSWQHITALRAAMTAHPEYSRDPKLAKLVCSFMEACLDAPTDLTFAKGERLSSQAQYNKRMGFFKYRSEQTTAPTLQHHLQPLLAYTNDRTQQMEIAIESAIRKLNDGMQKIKGTYIQNLEETPNKLLPMNTMSQVTSLMNVYTEALNNNPLPQSVKELARYTQFNNDLLAIQRLVAYQKDNSEEFMRLDTSLREGLQQLSPYPAPYYAAKMLLQVLKTKPDYRSAYFTADHPRVIAELEALTSTYNYSNF